MATNVVVACRFRPPSKNEKLEGASIIANVDPNGTTVTISDNNVGTGAPNKFVFDRVFDFVTPQTEVYEQTAKPMVKEVFAGYNTTIFAYGQTGSGKTHTMMGGKLESEKGIIPRFVEAIFNGIEEAEVGIEFTVKISYVEIYNERVRDLFTVRNSSSDNLKIREGTHGGVYIEGVTETYVNSLEQVLALMQQGQDNRAVASTNMNEQSSRSHSVFILTLGQLDQNTGSKKGAKLTLVDLAGSEKVGKTGAAGQTLDEAKSINKSLSALGNVINALTTQGQHVPYRDSKLTRLLSDSLGGNSKTVLLVTGSPMSTNLEETISTLRFGTRAKLIKNKATINQEKSVGEYKILLNQANTKIGIQSNLIDVLERDVANLLECIQAVEPANLVIPIPQLLSRDVSLLEKIQKKGADGTEDADGGALAAALVEEAHKNREAAAVAPTAVAVPSPTPVATAVASPAVAQVTVSQEALAAAVQAVGAVSNSNSPATSPDTTPVASPRASPAVVTLALPSLDSLAAAVPAASPAASPSDPLASPSGRKTSVTQSSVTHGLSELMLANSELASQLEELKMARRALEHNLEDNRRETQEAAEAFDKDRARFQTDLEEAIKAKKEADEKREKAEEISNEFNLLKQKVEFMRKEHALELSQAESQKTELSEELTRMSNKVSALEAKMAAQTKAYEATMEKIASENASGAVAAAAVAAEENAPASAPTSPADKEKKVFRPRMSEPPIQNRSVTNPPSESATGSHPLMFSSISSFNADPSLSIEEESKIDQLSRGLKRKCDQYVTLVMQYQAQTERVESLEQALDDATLRLKEHSASSSKKIKELEEKLQAAENLCAKFLESGRYWRQERNQKQKQTTSKIVVPLQSGGGKKPDASSSSSSSAALVSGATGPSPPPATSRLSGGGLASGARSAITSIQSAFSGKKNNDSMSSFF